MDWHILCKIQIVDVNLIQYAYVYANRVQLVVCIPQHWKMVLMSYLGLIIGQACALSNEICSVNLTAWSRFETVSPLFHHHRLVGYTLTKRYHVQSVYKACSSVLCCWQLLHCETPLSHYLIMVYLPIGRGVLVLIASWSGEVVPSISKFGYSLMWSDSNCPS